MTPHYKRLWQEFRSKRVYNDAEPVMRAVLEYFECPQEVLKDHRRNKELVFVRSVLWFFLRKHTILTLAECGYIVDNGRPFDHATVLYAVRNIERNISTVNGRIVDKVTAKVVEEIEQLLTEKNLLIKDA